MAAQFELNRSTDPARRLAGKVALVTGAGSEGDLLGIGVATAVLFAAHGARVGVFDVSAERAARTVALAGEAGGEAVALAGEAGGEAVALVGDVTSSDDCARAVGDLVERWGRFDALVNNAAIVGGGDVESVPEDVWARVLDVNLTGVMLMSKHAAPALRASGGGAVVNVSSIAGIRGFGSASYAATKAGLLGLTYDMAYTHGRDGIRVNCLVLGHLFTPMGNQGGEDLRERRRRAGLLGTEGNAWDAAWAALFLASEEARWITGVMLPVDAGTTSATALGVQNLEARHPA